MSAQEETKSTPRTSAQLHGDRPHDTSDRPSTGQSIKLSKRELRHQRDSLRQYKNNLLWQVGFLELSNALDFPANVWNMIPTPLFAAVLMGVGGSIAILWSIFAFWDMHKSLANVRLLRSERRFLKKWQQEVDKDETLETSCLVQAYLDVNVRELGWELIDRVMLDVCCGISGVLVGTGALMAIRGDIDQVYLASNLLSGYLGNSFLAPFALLNVFWASFMWMRAGGERKELIDGTVPFDQELRKMMQRHARMHKLYAVLNGVTAVLGCIGSIVSSTLWYGYVIIAPCIFLSVFANLLWRRRMGYDRDMVRQKDDLRGIDLLHSLHALQAAIDACNNGSIRALPCFTPGGQTAAEVARFMQDACLSEPFTQELSQAQPISEKEEDSADTIADDTNNSIAAAVTVISRSRQWLIYQGRFLVEVYGRYFRLFEKETALSKERP